MEAVEVAVVHKQVLSYIKNLHNFFHNDIDDDAVVGHSKNPKVAWLLCNARQRKLREPKAEYEQP